MADVDQPTYRIDDLGPLPLLQPGTVAELGECVRRAAADGQAIYPVGGGTRLGLGLPPTRPGIALHTTGLQNVIDFAARDMTVTVQTGIPLARLQGLLATERLRLPVDVAAADRATLGGALAANVSGPRRYGFGTLRDYVLGVSLVNDQGQETKAGGRVVKNVAGYDLCKLYVGSLGTLGVLTQVTLKLRPLPEEHALLTVGCNGDGLGSLLDALHTSRARPVCLDVLNTAAAEAASLRLPHAEWVVIVGFEDNRDAVTWQVQQTIREVPAPLAAGVNVLADRAAGPLWHALVELGHRPDAVLSFQANLLPSATALFLRRAAATPERLLLQAHAGNGIVRGHLLGDLTLERAAAILKGLQETASAAQGNVIVTHAPTAWKRALPIWGAPRGDVWLMRRVKEALDPHHLFNPGRFLDGI